MGMPLLETTSTGAPLGMSHDVMAAEARATYTATVRCCQDVRLRG